MTVGFLLAGSLFGDVQNACRDKLIEICDSTNEDGNPICRLLKQDSGESPDTIIAFLLATEDVGAIERERLLCARLLGRKTFNARVSLNSHVFISENAAPSGSGEHGTIYWAFDESSEDLVRLQRIEALFRELESLQRKPGRFMTWDFTGDVASVQFNYESRGRSSVQIRVQNLEILFTESIRGTGSLDDQIRFLEAARRKSYEDYMNIGVSKDGGS